MPLTFIDIERRTTWRILIFFFVLVLLYFVICLTLVMPFVPHAFVFSAGARRFPFFALVLALTAAAVHFLVAGYNAVNDVVGRLDGREPDPDDEIHRMLLNVMQEIHVVTGNKRKIRCMVFPSLSLNALAAADLKGEALIGITEGLLSRLTRPQLETVIAHEANHVLSGDCLETTVAASLFGSLSSLMDRATRSGDGRMVPVPAMLPALALLKLSLLLNLFISREREYRADAAAVRMTRNPVALAETLHLLSRSWRGSGFIGSGFEMLCIINPQAAALDETEGFWADLLSTHPPIRKRIERLLAMARVSIEELDRRAERSKNRAVEPASAVTFYAVDPRQQMQGPFTLAELASLPWLSPLTWISTGRQRPVDRAWKDRQVNAIFAARVSENASPLSDFACPVCRQQLTVEHYEGTQVFRCRFCSGALVETGKIPRIIARTGREQPCPERVLLLAKAAVNDNRLSFARWPSAKKGAQRAMPLLPCPKCGNPLYRGFYSQAHPVEIDRCGFCGLTWFDQDELQMLQCLIENRIAPDASVGILGAQTS